MAWLASGYFFLSDEGGSGRPDNGTGAAFLGCFGFLVSLLPRN